MGQFVKENAHLSTDKSKFDPNYEHIFNKDQCPCDECEGKRIDKQSCKEQEEQGAS